MGSRLRVEHNCDGMPSDQDTIQLAEENQLKGDIVKFCGHNVQTIMMPFKLLMPLGT